MSEKQKDIYIAMVSSAHNVCPKGYYIAIVSTIAERDSNNHLELQPGLERLGKVEEQFMGPPIPLYEPIDDGSKDNVFISKSYDATSHFESTTGTCLFVPFPSSSSFFTYDPPMLFFLLWGESHSLYLQTHT